MARVCSPPVLLSLRLISGNNGCDSISFGDRAMRYVCSLLEESGRFPLCYVASSLGTSGLLLMLEASDPMFLNDDMAVGHHTLLGRSAIQVHTGVFGMPFVAASKWCVASFEASSLRLGSASSCKLVVPFFLKAYGGWWLRFPATKTTGSVLHGPGCILLVYQGCLCKNAYVILL